jgi:hypothetical protein
MGRIPERRLQITVPPASCAESLPIPGLKWTVDQPTGVLLFSKVPCLKSERLFLRLCASFRRQFAPER